MKTHITPSQSNTCTGCQAEALSLPLYSRGHFSESYGAYCQTCRASALVFVNNQPLINDAFFCFTDQGSVILEFLETSPNESQIRLFLRLPEVHYLPLNEDNYWFATSFVGWWERGYGVVRPGWSNLELGEKMLSSFKTTTSRPVLMEGSGRMNPPRYVELPKSQHYDGVLKKLHAGGYFVIQVEDGEVNHLSWVGYDINEFVFIPV